MKQSDPGIKVTDARQERRNLGDNDRTQQFVVEAARQLVDLHCEDVVAFDVRGLSDVTDYVMIACGTSDRQIISVGRDITQLAKQFQLQRFGREVDEATTWLVLDFVDVVVHLFEPVMRAHYDIEMMWDDAPRITWKH